LVGFLGETPDTYHLDYPNPVGVRDAVPLVSYAGSTHRVGVRETRA